MFLQHVFTRTITKVKKNNIINTNRHDVFTDNTEIDAEQEEDAVRISIKEKHNNKDKKSNKNKRKK